MADEKVGSALHPSGTKTVPTSSGSSSPLAAGPPPATSATVSGKKEITLKTTPTETKDTFREVVETVVFVVVLVLLLKAFVAEAFVIPTGSMAETLYGYQKWVTCPECDQEFPVNCSEEAEHGRPPVTSCVCPSCRLHIEPLKQSCRSGDRVLVGKFLYDIGLRDPERYDVVVFKFPEEPQRNQTAKNYIKRLIGLERETIGILAGDLYVAELEYTAPELLVDEHGLPLATRRQMYKNDPKAEALLKSGSPVFMILRKPPKVMLAVQRLVYDNEHQARDLKKLLPPRWAPEKDAPAAAVDANPRTAYLRKRELADAEKAWVPDGPAGFRHPARPGDIVWLRYRHLNPDLRPTQPEMEAPCEKITDIMGYNNGSDRSGVSGSLWVGDLILECEVAIEQADGELVLELSRSVDRFQAHWNLATGICTFFRVGQDGKKQELDKKETTLQKPGKYRLRFANVDQRLTLWVDGKMPFGDGTTYDPPREVPGDNKSPPITTLSEKNDYEPVSIGVRGGAVAVQKLKVFRDTYYTNAQESVYTMYVQPGHYLCLGDNSPQSSDSRSWDAEDSVNRLQGGLVPRELMLGRALMVYWPPSRFGTIK